MWVAFREAAGKQLLSLAPDDNTVCNNPMRRWSLTRQMRKYDVVEKSGPKRKHSYVAHSNTGGLAVGRPFLGHVMSDSPSLVFSPPPPYGLVALSFDFLRLVENMTEVERSISCVTVTATQHETTMLISGSDAAVWKQICHSSTHLPLLVKDQTIFESLEWKYLQPCGTGCVAPCTDKPFRGAVSFLSSK